MRARRPGVSYVVENRHMMLRAFPDLFDDIGLRPIGRCGRSSSRPPEVHRAWPARQRRPKIWAFAVPILTPDPDTHLTIWDSVRQGG